MKYIILLIIIGVLYVVLPPIIKDIKSERPCFDQAQEAIEYADFQVKVTVWSQEKYCRETFDVIDALSSCVVQAQVSIPNKLQSYILPLINDFEIALQKREKSAQAYKIDHDEICKEYRGYRFEP